MADNDFRIHPPDPLRSPCPLAAALNMIGDRWTLLVIRDMLAGKRRYGEFLTSPERITTNILADRLRRLEQVGLVQTETYHERPPRREYMLTDIGRQLMPSIQALARWGADNIVGASDPTVAFATLTAEPNR